MPDVNDQLRAADTAKRAYQDAVRPLVEGTLEWIGDAAATLERDREEFEELIGSHVLAVEREGLLLSFGGPNIWLLWNGSILYGWGGSAFTYEPSSASEEDSAKKLLAYYIDNDIRPTADD